MIYGTSNIFRIKEIIPISDNLTNLDHVLYSSKNLEAGSLKIWNS